MGPGGLARQPAGQWPCGAGWPWQAGWGVGGVPHAKQLDGDGTLGRARRPAHRTQPSRLPLALALAPSRQPVLLEAGTQQTLSTRLWKE